jgi:hypothetical protein
MDAGTAEEQPVWNNKPTEPTLLRHNVILRLVTQRTVYEKRPVGIGKENVCLSHQTVKTADRRNFRQSISITQTKPNWGEETS